MELCSDVSTCGIKYFYTHALIFSVAEEKSKDLPSLLYILHVAKENLWLKFWNVALEHGQDGLKSSMAPSV